MKFFKLFITFSILLLCLSCTSNETKVNLSSIYVQKAIMHLKNQQNDSCCYNLLIANQIDSLNKYETIDTLLSKHCSKSFTLRNTKSKIRREKILKEQIPILEDFYGPHSLPDHDTLKIGDIYRSKFFLCNSHLLESDKNEIEYQFKYLKHHRTKNWESIKTAYIENDTAYLQFVIDSTNFQIGKDSIEALLTVKNIDSLFLYKITYQIIE